MRDAMSKTRVITIAKAQKAIRPWLEAHGYRSANPMAADTGLSKFAERFHVRMLLLDGKGWYTFADDVERGLTMWQQPTPGAGPQPADKYEIV